jgi:hypothetical protein
MSEFYNRYCSNLFRNKVHEKNMADARICAAADTTHTKRQGIPQTDNH